MKKNPEVDRRHFIQTTAAGITGLTIVNSSSVRGSQAHSRLRLGIIGCGGRGRFIGRLFREHTATEIVSLHDYFPDKVQALAEEFQVDESHCHIGLYGYRELLEDTVDAVAIMSPPYFHPEQTLDSVKAGKHVFLSKPVAVDVHGCQTILSAADRARGRLSILVDFQTRADALFREASRRIHSGAIGKPVLGQVYYQAGRLNPKAEGDSPEARLRNWVFDQRLSGDIIVEQNIHVIDVANWYLNSHPVRAFGTGGRKARTDVGDCWDHYIATFWYPEDVLVDFSSGQYLRGYSDLCIRVYGSDGTVDSHYGGLLQITGEHEWAGGTNKDLYRTGAIENIKQFHSSVLNGTPLFETVPPSVESNLTSILGRMAAYRQATVTWEEMMASGERIEADLDIVDKK
ncbi:MAG TPA: Gfo/Idh/MocA family oxidoreductase [Acidobacteriota bacterium]|nr:Gfo/Idh/MocA family oxidoreductase [Acidobacteriota bacterium]